MEGRERSEGWVQERKVRGGKGREDPLLQILVWVCHNKKKDSHKPYLS
jgi:hypothetical protein